VKIDQPAPSATPSVRLSKTGAPATSGSDAAERAKELAPGSAQVHALPDATGGGEFNAARVAAIREDIRAGRYQINPERIADGLIESVHDLLNPKKNS
jgi:negative regulator of flagellin synthesis FlgM